MAKGILVFDIPISCIDCPMCYESLKMSIGKYEYRQLYRCRIEPEDLEDPYLGDIMERKPDWCPLNPIPEKQINNNLYDEYYEGFDA